MHGQDKKHQLSLGIWIGLICVWIVGCSVGNRTPQAVPSKTEVVLPTTAVVSTLTVTSPTFTPQPATTIVSSPAPVVLPKVTMSSREAEAALQELLRTNGNCTGKCLAGIRPDEMTGQEAVDQMRQWGMLSMSKDTEGRTFITNLYLDPNSKQTNVNLAIIIRKNFETKYSVSFYIPRHEDGEFLGSDVWLAHRDSWQAFRLDNLLKAYGVPSFVGLSFQTAENSIAYTLMLHYEQMNLVIGFGGLAQEKQQKIAICPSSDPHNLGIQINPERPLKDVQSFYPITWQALTDTDLQSFYQKFTDESNPNECATTTIQKIVELDPSFR